MSVSARHNTLTAPVLSAACPLHPSPPNAQPGHPRQPHPRPSTHTIAANYAEELLRVVLCFIVHLLTAQKLAGALMHTLPPYRMQNQFVRSY